MTDLDSIDFFTDRSVVENPYPYFEHLREKCPAFREPHYGVVAVTGYDDVRVDVAGFDPVEAQAEQQILTDQRSGLRLREG